MTLAVSPDLIYTVVLPLLVFKAALQLKWRPFLDDLPVTVTLAFPGVPLTVVFILIGSY